MSIPDPMSSPSVSVVIATLGGPTLLPTIELLNRGSVVPGEILICIPEAEAASFAMPQIGNIKIIATSIRGQVAQRAVGFRAAANEFVLQLDDDMSIDSNCIERLLEVVKKEPKVAASAALIDVVSNESVYKNKRSGTILDAIYQWLMNGKRGYQQGRIDKAGFPAGVDPLLGSEAPIDVEWIAGGCVMHRRENLILEPFFPFPGKAYCEDIIHSHHLSARRIRLVVVPNARCGLEIISPLDVPWRRLRKELYADFKARRYFMRLSGRGLARMYLFYAIRLLSYTLKAVSR